MTNIKDSVARHYPLDSLAGEIMEIRTTKGFKTPAGIEGEAGEMMLAKLMLVATEVSEAAETVRNNDVVNFEEELADIIIRVLDLSATCGLSMIARWRSIWKRHRKKSNHYRHLED